MKENMKEKIKSYTEEQLRTEISNLYNQVKDIVNDPEKMGGDLKKFVENKNQAAGTRTRRYLQEIKSLSQNMRLYIQEVKNKKK